MRRVELFFRYTCNSEEQPLLLYQVACLSLKWMVNALQKSILLDMQSMIPTLNALLDGIIRLRDDVFTHILIFLYLECVPGSCFSTFKRVLSNPVF